MNPEIAKAIVTLLLRVDLKGNEVPAFNTIMQALDGIINPPPPPAEDE